MLEIFAAQDTERDLLCPERIEPSRPYFFECVSRDTVFVKAVLAFMTHCFLFSLLACGVGFSGLSFSVGAQKMQVRLHVCQL